MSGSQKTRHDLEGLVLVDFYISAPILALKATIIHFMLLEQEPSKAHSNYTFYGEQFGFMSYFLVSSKILESMVW